ncbi:MAG: threonylcarbamoyl-AMP synthase [Fibrobacter sp.]|nr:threonylcarbamoyl-AMP synthase [Fibrobacter sp.]
MLLPNLRKVTPVKRMYPPWTTITEASQIIREGGIVAIPTETVYGLAANALNALAVAKIFAAKERPTFDPLIVHIASASNLPEAAESIPENAWILAEKFMPGPLTLVLPKRKKIPDLVTSSLPTVGIRVPDHPIAREIIREAGVPLAAPSANLFQRVSPTTALHVAEQLGERIDGIVDGGQSRIGLESTIIAFPEGKNPLLLRPGAITLEMLRETIGDIDVNMSSSEPGKALPAPGMVDKHYQPATPLYYGAVPETATLPPKTLHLAFGKISEDERFTKTLNLSADGNLLEATANLYSFIRKLDRLGGDLIVVDPVPENGIGMAVNDRLKRASLKYFPEPNATERR